MKYCEHCGKELFDMVAICPDCGCSTAKNTNRVWKPAAKKSRIEPKWIAFGAIALVVVLILGIIFMPRNVKLDTLTTPANPVVCLITLGVPSRINDEGDWIYEDCIDFYGVPVENFLADFEDGGYVIYDLSDNMDDHRDKIEHFCDYEGGYSYDHYSYKNLEIMDTDSMFIIDVY